MEISGFFRHQFVANIYAFVKFFSAFLGDAQEALADQKERDVDAENSRLLFRKTGKLIPLNVAVPPSGECRSRHVDTWEHAQ
jgi:hypothetical protein